MWLATVWKFRNEIALGILILAIIGGCLYIRAAFKERDKLKEDMKNIQREMFIISQQQLLAEDINNAIRNIKIKVASDVSIIEQSNQPDPTKRNILINSGVLNIPTMYKTYSTTSTTSNTK